MEKVSTIGLDLAKNVFQVHGVDDAGQVVVRRKLRRSDVEAFFRQLPPVTIGMEACSAAHSWARVLEGLGHCVRLMPPAYVKPYVKRGKTDAADAEAICEAVTRPSMRFVPSKTEAQQAQATELKLRQLLVGQRTRAVNAWRGHLARVSVIAAKGLGRVADLAGIVRDPADTRLPSMDREALPVLIEQIEDRHRRIGKIETAIVRRSRADETARRLSQASARSRPRRCRRSSRIPADSRPAATAPHGSASPHGLTPAAVAQ
jgi:transposase